MLTFSVNKELDLSIFEGTNMTSNLGDLGRAWLGEIWLKAARGELDYWSTTPDHYGAACEKNTRMKNASRFTALVTEEEFKEGNYGVIIDKTDDPALISDGVMTCASEEREAFEFAIQEFRSLRDLISRCEHCDLAVIVDGAYNGLPDAIAALRRYTLGEDRYYGLDDIIKTIFSFGTEGTKRIRELLNTEAPELVAFD